MVDDDSPFISPVLFLIKKAPEFSLINIRLSQLLCDLGFIYFVFFNFSDLNFADGPAEFWSEKQPALDN